MENKWLPIKSAPRDGSKMLVYVPTESRTIRIASWDDERYATDPKPFFTYGSWKGKRSERKHQPTHWMPLPTPPSEND